MELYGLEMSPDNSLMVACGDVVVVRLCEMLLLWVMLWLLLVLRMRTMLWLWLVLRLLFGCSGAR